MGRCYDLIKKGGYKLANTTTNYRLNKPLKIEKVNVDVLNQNMDIIDENLRILEEKFSNVTPISIEQINRLFN